MSPHQILQKFKSKGGEKKTCITPTLLTAQLVYILLKAQRHFLSGVQFIRNSTGLLLASLSPAFNCRITTERL